VRARAAQQQPAVRVLHCCLVPAAARGRRAGGVGTQQRAAAAGRGSGQRPAGDQWLTRLDGSVAHAAGWVWRLELGFFLCLVFVGLYSSGWAFSSNRTVRFGSSVPVKFRFPDIRDRSVLYQCKNRRISVSVPSVRFRF
jgi:hypothetical protein